MIIYNGTKNHTVSLNTDGPFGIEGDAGPGMIVRDHNGDIILPSRRQLFSCQDRLGTELNEVIEGISLALEHL
jgi:hypothetical protein